MTVQPLTVRGLIPGDFAEWEPLGRGSNRLCGRDEPRRIALLGNECEVEKRASLVGGSRFLPVPGEELPPLPDNRANVFMATGTFGPSYDDASLPTARTI
jgi:hypothetical protein